jgi:hypothetical protein
MSTPHLEQLTRSAGRSKHVELEAVLDQKESEKQAILAEMMRSRQRQELLEQRLGKMVEVLRKACHSMGMGAISDTDLRTMQSIEDTASALDANKRYKRARLTIQTLDNQSLDAPLDRFFYSVYSVYSVYYSVYVRFTGAKVHILTQPRLQRIPPQRLLTDRPVAGLADARHEPRLGGAGPGLLHCLQQRPNAHHQQRVLLIYAMLDGTKISNFRH